MLVVRRLPGAAAGAPALALDGRAAGRRDAGAGDGAGGVGDRELVLVVALRRRDDAVARGGVRVRRDGHGETGRSRVERRLEARLDVDELVLERAAGRR